MGCPACGCSVQEHRLDADTREVTCEGCFKPHPKAPKFTFGLARLIGKLLR